MPNIVFNSDLVIDIIVLKAPKRVIGGIIEEEILNIIGEMEWFKNVDPFISIFDLVESIFSTSKEFLLEGTSALQYQINSTENLEKSRKNFSAKIVVSFESIFTLEMELIYYFWNVKNIKDRYYFWCLLNFGHNKNIAFEVDILFVLFNVDSANSIQRKADVFIVLKSRHKIFKYESFERRSSQNVFCRK